MRPERSEAPNSAPVLVASAATLALGPVTGGLAWALRNRPYRQPRRAAWAAAGGLGVAAIGGELLVDAGRAFGGALLRAAADPDVGYASALDEGAVWWLGSLPLAPALAWLLDWTTPKSVRELERRAQHRDDRRHRIGHAVERSAGVEGVQLGRRLGGDPVLPECDGVTVLPWAWLGRHALVLGASGSGRTETLLTRPSAQHPGWAVFFIDGKADRETMRRFYALMADAGRECRLFPDEPYDGWRGSSQDVAARLVEVIDFAEDGPGAYYRDQAVNLIRLACDAPGGPPRSTDELLERLSLRELGARYAGDPRINEVGAYQAPHGARPPESDTVVAGASADDVLRILEVGGSHLDREPVVAGASADDVPEACSRCRRR